jgi:hypothetical protein
MKLLTSITSLALILSAGQILHAKPLLESDFSDAEAARVLFSNVNKIGSAVAEFDSGSLKLEIPSGAPDYLFVRTEPGAINDDGEQAVKYSLVFENQSPAESIVSFGFWIRMGDAEFGTGYRILLYRDPGMSQIGIQRFNNKRPGQQGDPVWLCTPNELGQFGKFGETLEIAVTVKNTPQAVAFTISLNGSDVEVSDSHEDRITAGQGVGFNLDTNGSPGPVTILCDKITVTAEGE